jgi:hypothetical protein
MRRFAFAAIAVLGLALCASSQARAEDVDNPEFGYWSKFKAGSWVTMKVETEAAGNKTEMENTTTLLEITKEKAVVETKGHMMMGGNKIDIPANKREIPAKVKKGEEPKKDAPKPKEGDETIEVGGKKLKCHWIEVDSEANGMKTNSKSWMSDEVPGHTVKVESKSEGAMKSTTKMWADKWEAK